VLRIYFAEMGAGMPQFIDLPGGYVPNPPFLHTGATLHAFLVQGDQATLQSLIDETLNRVPGVHFNLVTDLVLVTGLYVAAVTATSPGWSGHGTTSEADVGVWVLTSGGANGQPAQTRWWPIYLFVDSAQALVIGREIYGFPKHFGQITRQSPDDADDPRVSIQTEYFATYASTATPTNGVLLQIRTTQAPPLAGFWNALVGPLEPVKLFAVVGQLLNAGAALLDQPNLPYVGMPMVFLKQFRDVQAAGSAAYQSIDALTISPTGAVSVGLVTDPIELVLQPCASHPIAAQLGLQAISRPVGPVFRVGMDFIAGFGEVISP
jgi:hypothetical protein